MSTIEPHAARGRKAARRRRWQQARLEHDWLDHVAPSVAALPGQQRQPTTPPRSPTSASWRCSRCCCWPSRSWASCCRSNQHLQNRAVRQHHREHPGHARQHSCRQRRQTAIKHAHRRRHHRPGRRAAHRARAGSATCARRSTACGASSRAEAELRHAKLVATCSCWPASGSASCVSLGLTTVGTAVTDQIMQRRSTWQRVPGIAFADRSSPAIVLGVARRHGDLRLAADPAAAGRGAARRSRSHGACWPPSVSRSSRSSARTRSPRARTARRSARSPACSRVLIWIQLVARYLLFCAAWAATATADGRPRGQLPAVTLTPTRSRTAVSPARRGRVALRRRRGGRRGLVSYLRRGRRADAGDRRRRRPPTTSAASPHGQPQAGRRPRPADVRPAGRGGWPRPAPAPRPSGAWRPACRRDGRWSSWPTGGSPAGSAKPQSSSCAACCHWSIGYPLAAQQHHAEPAAVALGGGRGRCAGRRRCSRSWRRARPGTWSGSCSLWLIERHRVDARRSTCCAGQQRRALLVVGDEAAAGPSPPAGPAPCRRRWSAAASRPARTGSATKVS